MKNINIAPFPNHSITENAINRDVKANSKIVEESDLKKLKKESSKKEIKVIITEFTNGERRMNFAVPSQIKHINFLAFFPNPILLYLSQAIDHFNKSETIANQFSSFSLSMWSGQEFLASSNDTTNDLYNKFLQNRISSIIMATCAIEAFMNFILPEDFTFVNSAGDELDKEKIQRIVKFKDKIDDIVPQVTGINVKTNHHVLRNKLLQLNRIRGEFVHLKYNKQPSIIDSYHLIFKDLANTKIDELILAVKEYINLNNPNFITDEY